MSCEVANLVNNPLDVFQAAGHGEAEASGTQMRNHAGQMSWVTGIHEHGVYGGTRRNVPVGPAVVQVSLSSQSILVVCSVRTNSVPLRWADSHPS